MYLSNFHLGIIVGIILGDGHLRRATKNSNTRIKFGQSTVNFPYLWFVFTLLSSFCAGLPYIESNKLNGILHYKVTFTTRTYVILNIIYYMFIIKGVKVVPQEIFHLLSPIALAHWIMSDGTGTKYGGLYICTDHFTIPDVCKIFNVLIIKFNLDCRLHMISNHLRIYIVKKDLPLLISIVKPYMHSFSMYKLSSGKIKKEKI